MLRYVYIGVVIGATWGPNQSERSRKWCEPIRIKHLAHVTKMTSQAPIFGHPIHVTPWGKEHHTQEVDPHSSHSFIDRVKPGNKRDVCEVRMTSRPFLFLTNLIADRVHPQSSRSHRDSLIE